MVRLDGPFRVEDVAVRRGRLSQQRDKYLANGLFRAKPHHQEDLDPILCAALPWFRQLVPHRFEH